MTKTRRQQLGSAFRTSYHNRSGEIDPGQKEDWYSLTLGRALGKGLPPVEAIEFARYIRYQTDMG